MSLECFPSSLTWSLYMEWLWGMHSLYRHVHGCLNFKAFQRNKKVTFPVFWWCLGSPTNCALSWKCHTTYIQSPSQWMPVIMNIHFGGNFGSQLLIAEFFKQNISYSWASCSLESTFNGFLFSNSFKFFPMGLVSFNFIGFQCTLKILLCSCKFGADTLENQVSEVEDAENEESLSSWCSMLMLLPKFFFSFPVNNHILFESQQEGLIIGTECCIPWKHAVPFFQTSNHRLSFSYSLGV